MLTRLDGVSCIAYRELNGVVNGFSNAVYRFFRLNGKNCRLSRTVVSESIEMIEYNASCVS